MQTIEELTLKNKKLQEAIDSIPLTLLQDNWYGTSAWGINIKKVRSSNRNLIRYDEITYTELHKLLLSYLRSEVSSDFR